MPKATSYLCADCGADTTPCSAKRGCRHSCQHNGRWEHYMVHDRLWREAGMKDGFLCIGCLEHRLGRRLTPRDFPSLPINHPHHPWHTTRLAARLPHSIMFASDQFIEETAAAEFEIEFLDD